MSVETDEKVPVPAEWQAIGFSGLFQTEATIEPGTEVAWQERVPCRLPFGSNGAWLAIQVNADRLTVTIVRQDASALCDIGGFR